MMKFPQNNIIDNWLKEHGNPEVEKYVEKNLAIVNKVNTLLKERGIKKQEFTKMLGKKNPSEVTKLLSGMHNITLKTIIKMEVALNIDLINIEPVVEYKYVYLGLIEGDEIKNAISESQESQYKDSDVLYA